jgi:A/G-specific adenine glycosylase
VTAANGAPTVRWRTVGEQGRRRDSRDRGLAARLIRWFEKNRRDLPWRRGRSPYRVWISEVMLQQTTADVVSRRFEAFVRSFPDVRRLAGAPASRVVEAWAGLGYYRRARMLHAAARECVARFGGELPRTWEALRSLPGIGEYTAGAIASMGFGEPRPAVDGNVARVWARFDASPLDIGSAAVRRRFGGEVLRFQPPGRAAQFNEALIELGATTCRPVLPRCGECPIREGCLAFGRGEVDRYPAATRRKPSVAVTSARGILRDGAGRVLVVRRPKGASLLPGFDELPGRWLAPGEDVEPALADVFAALGCRRVRIGERVSDARHVITHHRIRSVAYDVRAGAAPRTAGSRFASRSELLGPRVTTETRKLLASVP